MVGLKDLGGIISKQFPKKKALMLYGPAGTGKTSLAIASAKENNLEILELNSSDLRNKKKLEEKTFALKKEFGNNWFFVVTNKEFARFYNKYGKTFTRKKFIKQFSKWIKNT